MPTILILLTILITVLAIYSDFIISCLPIQFHALSFPAKLIGAILSALLYVIERKTDNARKNKERREDRIVFAKPTIENRLNSAVTEVFLKKFHPKVRGNVMLVQKYTLKTLLTHRTVRPVLKMEFTFGLYSDEIRRLAWKYGQGSCGYTWKRAINAGAGDSTNGTFTEADELRVESWNMTRLQIDATRETQFLISVPIVTMVPKRGTSYRKVIGILNIDGDVNLERDNIKGIKRTLPDRQGLADVFQEKFGECSSQIRQDLLEYGLI